MHPAGRQSNPWTEEAGIRRTTRDISAWDMQEGWAIIKPVQPLLLPRVKLH
jgi:hypothetical protein